VIYETKLILDNSDDNVREKFSDIVDVEISCTVIITLLFQAIEAED